MESPVLILSDRVKFTIFDNNELETIKTPKFQRLISAQRSALHKRS